MLIATKGLNSNKFSIDKSAEKTYSSANSNTKLQKKKGGLKNEKKKNNAITAFHIDEANEKH